MNYKYLGKEMCCWSIVVLRLVFCLDWTKAHRRRCTKEYQLLKKGIWELKRPKDIWIGWFASIWPISWTSQDGCWSLCNSQWVQHVCEEQNPPDNQPLEGPADGNNNLPPQRHHEAWMEAMFHKSFNPFVWRFIHKYVVNLIIVVEFKDNSWG